MQRWRHPAPDPDEPNLGSDDPGTDARISASKPEPFGPGTLGHAQAAVDAARDGDQTDGRSEDARREGSTTDGEAQDPAVPASGARSPAGAHEQTVVARPADHPLAPRADPVDSDPADPPPADATEATAVTPGDRGDDAPTVVAGAGDDAPTVVAAAAGPADDAERERAGDADHEPTVVASAGTDPTNVVADGAPATGDAGEDGDADGEGDDESTPSASSGLKHILFGILGMVVLIIAIRLLAPHVGFLDDTWQKVRKGDPVWLILCVVLEVFSFAGYVWVFNATAVRSGLRLPRVTTWRITLAGVAATRLIATAGAGGIAATTFALRRHGLDARAAAATVTAQLAIVYGWFIFLIMLTGLALFVGGHGHAAITIVPAAIAAGILVTAAGGRSVIRKLARVSEQREGRVAEAVAVIPGTLDDAVATVVTLVRERDTAIIGGALWWLADAGVLWAACHAFGASPNVLDVTMAYLLGQTANLLPIPGGLGVEAGLLGMLIAFGVPGGVAVLASLVQRLISTWLPALPGALALASIGHASPDAEVVSVDDDPPPPGVAATAA